MVVKKHGNKIATNLAGEILSSSASTSNKILHIDKDLQVPNRIHKNDTNQVSQVIDKAQNIVFTPITAKCSFNYADGYVCDTVDRSMKAVLRENVGITWFIITTTFKTTSLPNTSGQNSYFQYYANSNENLFVVTRNENGIYFFRLGMNSTRRDINFTPVLGREYDVAFVFFQSKENSASYFRIYVDGEELDSIQQAADTVNISDITFLRNQGDGGAFSQKYLALRKLTSPLNRLTDEVKDLCNSIFIKDRSKYHHRHKEGETYLSFQYLKNALIDTDNRIERIYNSIKDTYFEQTVLANRPRRTEQGVGYLSGESLLQSVSDEYTYGTGNFFLGRWVDFKNESVVFTIGGAIDVGIDATNIYVETSGGKLYANKANAINEGFKYIGFHRENGNIYLSVNGLYENSRTESVDYNTDQIATIGGTFIGTDTDMYNAKESIISFIGKVQGNKTFEPPRRGGFNSDIKQY